MNNHRKEQVKWYKYMFGFGGILVSIMGGIILLGFDKDAGIGIIIGITTASFFGCCLSHRLMVGGKK